MGSAAVTTGLVVQASDITIQGLTILNFSTTGIELANRPTANTNRDVVIGCYIGRDRQDDPGGGNGDGILVRNSNDTIGGVAPTARNVISGNSRDGIRIIDDYNNDALKVEQNLVIGNYIGTDVNGMLRRSNERDGIYISESSFNTIGGANVAARNLISGNNLDGIGIDGGEFDGNGVLKARGNLILGNFIGTNSTGNGLLQDSSGTPVVGNARWGVFISDSNRNTIGSPNPLPKAQPNVISGNGVGGIRLFTVSRMVGVDAFQGGGNVVQNNYIGTDYKGTAALGNGPAGNGILIDDSSNETISNNLISGNNGFGIVINVVSGSAGDYRGFNTKRIDGTKNVNNRLTGNTIGLDVNKTTPLANGRTAAKGGTVETSGGVLVVNSANNLIDSNTISGNQFDGVRLVAGSNQNVLRNNLIGINAANKALGNGQDGVLISDSPNNLIGGPGKGDPNTISANGGDGVKIIGLLSTRNLVQQDNLGTDIKGATVAGLGNKGNGVTISALASNNSVSGSTIAGNAAAGIRALLVLGGNFFDPNSIFDNGALGIDNGPDGVTYDDPTFQNFPLLSAAVVFGNQITITGTVTGTPDTTLLLEFFSNPLPDPSGFGEGKDFIGATDLTTDDNGNADFTISFSISTDMIGTFVSATATDPLRGTSEFSGDIPVAALVTLNALNNNTTAIIHFDDQSGNSATENVYVSQFNVTLAGLSTTPRTFNTFCIDLPHLVFIGQTYAVFVRNDVDTAFVNGSRMAYIFENFGLGDLSNNPDQAAAVQLALWDLSLNNHNPTFFQQDGSVYDSGDSNVFSVDLGTNPDGAYIAQLTDQYLHDSLGATTHSDWLDAAAAGTDPNRGQSLMLPSSLFPNMGLAVSGHVVNLTEGQTASVLVGTITGADAGVQASDFTATVNWGDGSALDGNTTIVANGNAFDIYATHTYAEEGDYQLALTVGLGTSQRGAAGFAVVDDAPLTTVVPPLSFAPATGSAFAAGSQPDSVSVLTLDDGTAVVLTANFSSSNVTLWKSNGDGTFTSLGTLATGNGPNGFAIGDFNGDGHQDFTIANYSDNTVTVYLGDGAGNFTAGPSLATGSGPANEMALGDFNGDGKLDVATANFNDGTVSVLFGNGDGTFQSAVSYNVGAGSIAITALNTGEPGGLAPRTDLAVANYNNSTVTVLHNNGDGTFTVGAPMAVGANPWFIAAGDFNGDGADDLATANFGGSNVSVLLANGDGTFGAAVNYAAGANLTGVVAADMNGDGILDLVTSNYGSNNASVLLGNGDGTFQGPQNFATGSGPNGVAVGDFNHNGLLGIAVANQDSNTVTVLLGQATQAAAGQPFTGEVARFTDANPFANVNEFTATIYWQDGTITTVSGASGGIVHNQDGSFSVQGTNTFANAGLYGVFVIIDDVGGASTSALTRILVA
ncbi:hypothetical protein AYO44_05560 [Planctomycetaceae bacterium SCGC AG-212-F19]|nr:hypothetical protein AYO44_05560 [Planctomycetaceae bacterium SCGC AG-212-F19]